jgi:type II secretory pathway component PulF
MQDQDKSLTLLDMIGLSVIGIQLFISVTVWPFLVSPTFKKMYEDFGSTIPSLTNLALSPFASVFPALAIGALFSYALLRREERTMKRTRVMLLVCFLGLLVLQAVLFSAMYLPIFQISNQIGAE